ncbi:MAG: CDP-diacylglycerol--glycerol-3-phosphate 3-phosphatidyltransferase [Lachnospiraceae bacterium]|nr:CDP-diacylglycerol--glycerol-3-phosphate 3-phosphatidyltransferase [Lachnospiraceae bacterium]
MNLPNRLTVLRIVIIPFFIFFLMASFIPFGKWVAFGLFIIASFTDYLDGHIARKKNLITDFGKFADPLADKLLVCSALICLLANGSLGKYGFILVLVIISRDFIISGFSACTYYCSVSLKTYSMMISRRNRYYSRPG